MGATPKCLRIVTLSVTIGENFGRAGPQVARPMGQETPVPPTPQ